MDAAAPDLRHGWRPTGLQTHVVGGVFQGTGNQAPLAVPLKGDYVMLDFKRCARRLGVPFHANPHFPFNTVNLMRIAVALLQRGDGRFGDFCAAVFQAIWVNSADLSDPTAVAAVLTHAGFDPKELLAMASEPEIKDALKAATDAAVQRGVFGAPTMFVGDHVFWGQDRLDFVRDALTH
ncbi:2-hydroxychromene-2-carboxylate isomerase [Rhodoferax sp. PAMC 29310]|uniref:2-hydroxychromene-2-carboxylate isomerase n=1 Tax=Rhodoferax sp. PAMC 29310 TaxID=2822760 RepID=UPI00351D497B